MVILGNARAKNRGNPGAGGTMRELIEDSSDVEYIF